MSTKPAPVFVCNASAPKKSVKKTTKFVPKKSLYKRLDIASNANKYRYLRFKFSCPTFNDANGIIDSLYNEKVIDWSYVVARDFNIPDETGGKKFVIVHGILRIEDFNSYDWNWFRARWPNAFFKYGYYPENSYPRKDQTAPQTNNSPTQEQGQSIELVEEGTV